VTCAGSSACVAGICVDDPCRLIRCPGGTRCVPWEGSCEHVGGEVPDGGIPDGGNVTPDLSGPEGLRDGGLTGAPDLWGFSAPGAGCETAPGPAQASSTVALAAFGLALALGLLWRRTRGNRATAA
jgi:MYXO-CTERM domain-containing protein